MTDRAQLESLVKHAEKLASMTGCVDYWHGICVEVWPESPNDWCPYCTLGRCSRAIEALTAREVEARTACHGCARGWPRARQDGANYWHRDPKSPTGSEYLCIAKALEAPAPAERTWSTIDGNRCVNCGRVLTQHKDQMYCPEPAPVSGEEPR